MPGDGDRAGTPTRCARNVEEPGEPRTDSIHGVVSAGIEPRRPSWKSSKAWSTSALVFMTNGPAIATGSRIGLPPRTNTSSDSVRESWVSDAAIVMVSPRPNTVS